MDQESADIAARAAYGPEDMQLIQTALREHHEKHGLDFNVTKASMVIQGAMESGFARIGVDKNGKLAWTFGVEFGEVGFSNRRCLKCVWIWESIGMIAARMMIINEGRKLAVAERVPVLLRRPMEEYYSGALENAVRFV